MARIKNLNLYQKIILLLLAAMLAAFTTVYFVASSRIGFAYRGTILQKQNVGESVVYTGRIKGTPVCFTVTADKTVTYAHGDKTYGPYTAHEDPTAIPDDNEELAQSMVGVEVRDGDTVFFRGGVLTTGYDSMEWLIMEENGSFSGIGYSVNGISYDSEGNVVDENEPAVSTILRLMAGPELTARGYWSAWFGGVFLSLMTAVLILFADELFLLHMSFRVRDPQYAEPSDMEITGRYISWTVIPIMALVLYIMGLKI